MKILISGASGLIGSALRQRLSGRDDAVSALVRRPPGPGELRWDPNQPLDPSGLAGVNAVVHLSGKNIAGRWTGEFKREIRESRVQSTRTLSCAVAESFRRTGSPSALICASAIGYYGNRGEEVLTEESSPGRGFLPELCVAWEEAADPARAAGLRVVQMRIGVVLARDGGALQPMLLPFKLGLGGRIGDGRQFWSWVSLEDLIAIFTFAIDDQRLHGAVNAVAPNPVRNAEFVKALGRELRRPVVVPLPSFAVSAILGEMGRTLLLDSARVKPAKLESAGYRFLHPELGEALRCVLKA